MAKAFASLVEDRDPAKVLIVDSMNLAFRWKHQGVTDFEHEYIRTVKSLAKSYDCGKIVIAADWGNSSFRRAIDPEYKMNRKELRDQQSEQEKAEFEAFFREYETTLEGMKEEGFPVFRFRGVEADDIAAYITRHRKKFGIEEVWLISSDRDWDLLVTEDVSRFSYVTRKETTLDNWEEFYDFEPDMYLTFKCLTGDKGDNVPGIPGIGPKRAASILDTYGDVFDIHAMCPLPGKYKYIQALNDNADQLLTNVELMDLLTYCEDAVGSENAEYISETMLEYMNEN